MAIDPMANPTPEGIGLAQNTERQLMMSGRQLVDPARLWERDWMTPDGRTAVGMNRDGTVDEILTADGVHLEQMNDSEYFLQVGELVVWISAVNKRIEVRLQYLKSRGSRA